MEEFTEIRKVYDLQADKRKKRGIPSYAERKQKLRKLLSTVYSESDNILQALKSDLNKSFTEGKLIEIYPVVSELKHALRNLKSWMKPRRVSTPITMFGAKSRIVYDPKGVALIMSPWNYPFLLSMSPIIAAVAAGNSVILKPSEKSLNTSALLKGLLSKVFSKDEVSVIQGDHVAAQALLKLKFDHIFFTGSPSVGKLVMQAAAKQLTSVTLELGGKSPVVVDGTYDIKTTAKRIAWGKLINAGQTCIAPDYLLIKENIADDLISKIIEQYKILYGVNGDFHNAEDYPRIIDEQHTKKLKNFIEEEKKSGSRIPCGGKYNEKEVYVEPTIFSNVNPENPIMKEEIFGPLLPVLKFRTIDEVINIINNNPNPLSLYIFSKDKKFISSVMKKCPSGGMVINDTIIHFANANLPFGGVQNSGIGKAHGYFGFLEFTNQRAVVKQSGWTPVSLLYPPYNKWKEKLADIVVRYF